ncbi:MAG TPA: hypothetical protein VHY08_26260, partial [Bacillota bacterium]|nr:hypothetical protein [Bacillota bacterium]
QPTKLDVGKIGFEDIRQLKFQVDQHWQLALLKDKKTKCEFWSSKEGKNWTRYPEGPDNNRIDLDEDWYFLYPHFNSVAILRKQKKLFDIYSDNQWQSFSVPEGTRWIDLEPNGSLLAVGSKPAIRVKNAKEEVACWRKEKGSVRWEEKPIVMDSWWNASKIIEMGGFGQLQEADTRMEPYVFASECSWFLDDASWFIYVKLPSGKFYGHRLRHLVLDKVERDANGLPVVFASNYVQNVRLTWSGKKWMTQDLTQPITKLLNQKGYFPDTPLALSFAGHDQRLLAVGQMFRDQRARVDNIVLQSNNAGLDWEIKSIEDGTDSVIFRPFMIGE